MAAGEWRRALSLAAKFPRLGTHKNAIVDAHEAYTHPDFYRQLGKDVDAVIQAGIAALKDRYK
jgi:hypothetical protein